MVVLVLMLTSKGSAGVAGAGFVALAASLASLPQIPVAGIVLLLGGNGVATIVVAGWEGELDRETLARELASPSSVADRVA